MESVVPDAQKCWLCPNAGTVTVDIGDETGQVLRTVCAACLAERFI